jgi:hypothetical protein
MALGSHAESNHIWHQCQWFTIAGVKNRARIVFFSTLVHLYFFLVIFETKLCVNLSRREHISTDKCGSVENFFLRNF